MKKIGLIALALVLSLGLMGAGLAYWTETLTIEGDVGTGKASFEFINVSCTADAPITAVPTLSDSDGDGDDDTLTITVTDIYPCGEAECHFTVRNNGTIPMNLASVTITDPQAGVQVTVTDGNDKVDMDLDGDGLKDITVWLSKVPDGIGVVGVGGSFPGHVYIHGWNQGTWWPSATPNIYEGNDASENASGSFMIAMKGTPVNS